MQLVDEALTHEAPLAERHAGTALRGGYRVRAVWRTLQGEGAFAGRPAVFVRFAGCNMWSGHEKDRERDFARIGASCALFCDTDFRKEGAVRLSAGALVEEVLRVGGDIRFVVLTGGEPLLQVDAALVAALHAAGVFIAVETNGTVSLDGACGSDPAFWPDWVACSPKLPEERLELEAFDELKLVVPAYTPEAYRAFALRGRPQRLGSGETHYLWLQPEDGPRLDEARRMAIRLSLAHPAWRVSVQTHKILQVD